MKGFVIYTALPITVGAGLGYLGLSALEYAYGPIRGKLFKTNFTLTPGPNDKDHKAEHVRVIVFRWHTHANQDGYMENLLSQCVDLPNNPPAVCLDCFSSNVAIKKE